MFLPLLTLVMFGLVFVMFRRWGCRRLNPTGSSFSFHQLGYCDADREPQRGDLRSLLALLYPLSVAGSKLHVTFWQVSLSVSSGIATRIGSLNAAT